MNWSLSTRSLVALLVLLSGIGAVGTTAVAANPAVQLSSVSVSPEDPNTGERVMIDAKISNLENSDTTVEVRDVYVRTTGTTEEYARIEDVGAISPGGSLSVPVPVTFDTAGEKALSVYVVVQDGDGEYHRYSYPLYVDVTDPTVRADLSSQTDAGTTAVSLTNFGNTDLSDVEITASVDGEVLERNFLYDVAPGSNGTATFDTADLDSETVRFVATYSAADETHETVHSVDLDEQTEIPGEIRLTAVETTRTGSSVIIEGDAANLGGTDADSVLVSVGEDDGVRPIPPSGEYFVGAIDASEFATFELTAEADRNASSVPVEITYLVDNERATTTQRVSLDDAGAPSGGVDQASTGERPSDGDAGGPPLTLLGGVAAVVLLVGVGIGLYRWRT